jgi:penicillin-insensitive murein DD-endopeptidase
VIHSHRNDWLSALYTPRANIALLLTLLGAGLTPSLAAAAAPTAIQTASICYGTVTNGRLSGGVSLPASGPNFAAYSSLGHQLGRTYVHATVRDIVLQTYTQLLTSAPGKTFVYGETGFARGGVFKPHHTHQNGLSVDFMVPVLNTQGQSVPLPSSALNKFGYAIEFDDKAQFEGLSIDFQAMAEHLYQLQQAATQAGVGINLLIFERNYLRQLFATPRGAALQGSLQFMKKPPWVRHDEHYHVDFKISCRNATS